MYIYVHTSKYIRSRVSVICDDGLPSAEIRLARGSWPHPHASTWPENGAVTAWKPKSKKLSSTLKMLPPTTFIYLTIFTHRQSSTCVHIYWHWFAQSQVSYYS